MLAARVLIEPRLGSPLGSERLISPSLPSPSLSSAQLPPALLPGSPAPPDGPAAAAGPAAAGQRRPPEEIANGAEKGPDCLAGRKSGRGRLKAPGEGGQLRPAAAAGDVWRLRQRWAGGASRLGPDNAALVGPESRPLGMNGAGPLLQGGFSPSPICPLPPGRPLAWGSERTGSVRVGDPRLD